MSKQVSVGAIILYGGNILIIKESPDAKHWSIPKGKVEQGEIPWETAIREIWEETNILIDSQYHEYLGKHKYRSDKDLIVFKVMFYKDPGEIKCNSTHLRNGNPEVCDFKWVPFNEYDKYFSENLNKVMEESLA